MSRDLANWICEALRRNGQQALLAGGCVRDLLLGREPADYDVATEATPDQVLALFPRGIAVGARFGVVIVPEGEDKVEVATFRSDVGYSDGRHPDQVRFARTPEEDVRRRDFTINGLLMRADSGEVLDFVGGQADLRAHLVRAVGDPDRRFAEDKLRMMRAVRFAARFNYAIEPSTLSAIRAHAPQIVQVSRERVRDECTKILTEGAARHGFELLDETGLLGLVLPEVAAMRGVPQPPQFHPEGDVWIHTRLMLDKLPAGCSHTLAWGVLLHDVGKPPTFKQPISPDDRIRFDGHVEIGVRMAEEICHRLRFSNDDTQQILALVANHMRFKDAVEMRLSTLKRLVRQPRFEEHLELHRLDCLSSHGNLDTYSFVQNFLRDTPPEKVRPPRLITGDDLRGLGLSPGPQFRELLQAVEDAQLEGQVSDRSDALALVRRHLQERSHR